MHNYFLDPGIILLDKAEGISSAKAIAQVKKKLLIKKIGHAGTLDPLASGLIVCVLNRATKLADYAMGGEKTYSGIIRLGLKTDTDDLCGQVLEETSIEPAFSVIQETITKHFLGSIKQVPPNVSAIKVDGERAYAMFRQGKSLPELNAREIRIKSFEVHALENRRLSFRIHCSSGTYIRSIARDLGDLLGCGGCIESLRREESWPFNVESAKKVEDLSESDILDWCALFPGAPRLCLDKKEETLFRNGNPSAILSLLERGALDGISDSYVIGLSEANHKEVVLMENRSGKWSTEWVDFL